MAVIIETSIGQLTVDLYTDERPRCSKNFLKLCKVKYYNFSLFHSVQHNLVAQTGDPTATGRGGMSVYGMVYGEQARYFDMEIKPRIKHTKRGQLSMVNNGNGKHGSQFFITLGHDLDYLDGEHTVFGEVAEGWEVLDKLNEAYCDEKHRPYRDIRIFHTVIIDDPFDDLEGLVFPDKSPEPTQEMLESDRIGVDEEVDDTKGLTDKQVQELQAEREAKANAQLLEMVGDIPDVDVAPPDNVLFVCKLNPVTTDEDLSMIFSRFGPIVSCEVIKDHSSGQSLQYAFVEFEDPRHCENAYFKMDNVLIDDRRIHVDFSQSVSKIRPNTKGKKEEEEKGEDKPRYVLKNQQRTDDKYDLVYEHDDLPEVQAEPKKAKKHKRRRHSDSDQDQETGNKKKTKAQPGSGTRSRSRSRSPRDGGGDKSNLGRRDRKTSPSPKESSRKEKKRERRSPSSDSGNRKERRRKERSPSSDSGNRKERRRKERSPSSEEDRRKEKKKKERSPPSDGERKKERRKKDRCPSPEEYRKKEKKRTDRSPSSETDRRKEGKKKDRLSSADTDRKKEKRKKDRSPSPEEYRRKKKRERRSSSSPEDGRRDRRREERGRDRR